MINVCVYDSRSLDGLVFLVYGVYFLAKRSRVIDEAAY